MKRSFRWLPIAAVGTLLLAGAPAPAVEPAATVDAATLAARIDSVLAQRWAAERVSYARAADDAEFLRRVSVDLIGRIPSVSEARSFLADPSPEKRQRLVARLLRRPAHAAHFAAVWRRLLIPEADNNQQVRFGAGGFEQWLRQRFADRVGYDELVRELLTLKPDPADQRRFYRGFNESTPVAFYLAKEYKPENLAAGSARVLLGLRLECAQCHDHPFASWKRDQFWQYAAFFSGLGAQKQGEFVVGFKDSPGRREMAVPGTERFIQAAFLDGTQPRFRYGGSVRQELADWITRPDNPYFARATVNRVWALLFGIGLVDPVDDLAGGPDAVSQYPELLDELSRAFVEHRFDLDFLIEAIVTSRAYQLSSAVPGAGPAMPRELHLFSRRALRAMSGEQLFASVAEATGYRDSAPQYGFAPQSARAKFLSTFPSSDKPTELQTSIVQALTLMNGKLVADMTNDDWAELLAAVVDAPFFDDRGRIETLFLATVTRMPRQAELTRALNLVNGARDPKAARQAYSDLFWALLNSTEFVVNR